MYTNYMPERNESDNEHKAAISEAEQILEDAKESYRDSLIRQEMHPEPHTPDSVQTSAVQEAQKIANSNRKKEYLITISKEENRKLYETMRTLEEIRKNIEQNHKDEDEWQERVLEKIIPPNDERSDYPRKYTVIIGKDITGTFYRVQHVRVQDDNTELVIEASQLSQPTRVDGLGLYVPSMIHEVYNPKDFSVIQKTTFDEPDLASRNFTKLYDKAKPGTVERASKWIGQRLRFKNKS